MLREGNYMEKAKTDIKGFDFVKATTSEYSEKLFKGLIDDYIMGDEINTRAVLQGLKDYGNEIRASLEAGDVTFLPITSAKPMEAYKDPKKLQSVRAILAWNIVYPDNEIEVPSKPKVLKLNIYSEKDLEKIEDKYPEVVNAIRDKVFHDTTGIFISKKKKTATKNGEKIVSEVDNAKGLTVLAIPATEKIPEWAKPFIDYDTTIDTVLAPFKSVVEILGVQKFEVSKTVNGSSRKSETISNIIRF